VEAIPTFLPFDPLKIVIAKVTLGGCCISKYKHAKFFCGKLVRLANFIDIMSTLKSIIFVVTLEVSIHDVED
jgi:hypothetical protein